MRARPNVGETQGFQRLSPDNAGKIPAVTE
jgi:hypothetical protein